MNISSLKPEDIFMRVALEKGPLKLEKQLPISLNKSNSQSDEELLEACRQFEAIFLNQLLKEMRKTVPKDGLIPQSYEQEIFTGMFDEEVAKNISKSNRMGMADMLFEQLRDHSKDDKKEFKGEIKNARKYYRIDGGN